jgi:predicted esterase
MYQYYTHINVGDFGAEIDKLILKLPAKASISDVDKECFSVFVARKDPNTGEVLMLPKVYYEKEKFPSQGYRSVKTAYTSDESGNPVAIGEYITLEMNMEGDNLGKAISTVGRFNIFVDCEYRITQVKEFGGMSGLVFDEFAGNMCTKTNGWKNDESTLKYGYFTPKESGKRPLIIWLHGAGEGGEDPRIAYMGNNVVNLSSPEIQAFFGGAYVLAPQVPTMWLDDGSHQYGRSGKSMYRDDLKTLIDTFIASHPIDTDRIYIGGCSNGGFMTMRMLCDYPGFFAGAYPMCQALFDEVITEENIATLKNENIWFVHAMTDSVVDPKETSVPTYERLMKAGAKNVHFTYINDKPPRRSVNHFCWLPGLRNECREDYDGKPVLVDGKPVSLFEWLAHQRKQESL